MEYFGIFNKKDNPKDLIIYRKPAYYDYFNFFNDLEFHTPLFNIDLQHFNNYQILIKAIGFGQTLKLLENLKSLNLFASIMVDKSNQTKVEQLKKDEYKKLLSAIFVYQNQDKKVGLLDKKNQQHNKFNRILKHLKTLSLEITELREKLDKSFASNMLDIDLVVVDLLHKEDDYRNYFDEFYSMCEEFFSLELDNVLTFLKSFDAETIDNELKNFIASCALNTDNLFYESYGIDDVDIPYKTKKKKRKVVATKNTEKNYHKLSKKQRKQNKRLLIKRKKEEKR